MNWLAENWDQIWLLVATTISLASAVIKIIIALTPSDADNKWYKKFKENKLVINVYKVINMIALNPKK